MQRNGPGCLRRELPAPGCSVPEAKCRRPGRPRNTPLQKGDHEKEKDEALFHVPSTRSLRKRTKKQRGLKHAVAILLTASCRESSLQDPSVGPTCDNKVRIAASPSETTGMAMQGLGMTMAPSEYDGDAGTCVCGRVVLCRGPFVVGQTRRTTHVLASGVAKARLEERGGGATGKARARGGRGRRRQRCTS